MARGPEYVTLTEVPQLPSSTDEVPKNRVNLPGPRHPNPWHASFGGVIGFLTDIINVIIALLFIIFGFLVYSVDGKPAGPDGSEARRLLSIARYVSISSRHPVPHDQALKV
ncbi:hypothetical protein VTN00DRAFT_5431 [Thermoascus crustaceus]|uniref:uncharacterized protein n=1 Tax=Thermoascus crustaceus TaxID=5088 RepID=UPI003742FD61